MLCESLDVILKTKFAMDFWDKENKSREPFMFLYQLCTENKRLDAHVQKLMGEFLEECDTGVMQLANMLVCNHDYFELSETETYNTVCSVYHTTGTYKLTYGGFEISMCTTTSGAVYLVKPKDLNKSEIMLLSEAVNVYWIHRKERLEKEEQELEAKQRLSVLEDINKAITCMKKP